MDQSSNYCKNKVDEVSKLREKFNSNREKINFSPKINRNLLKINRERGNLTSGKKNPNVFCNLYELAKKRSERLAIMRNEFHSQFNYVPITNQNFPITSSFYERQKAFSKRVEENRKKYIV
jgi:hypothetical protein